MGLLRLLTALLFIGSSALAHEPTATTPLGRLRGHWMTSRAGRRYMAFSGVPYAKPPVDDLALQPPEPLQPWRGARSAKESGPPCLQYNLYDLDAKVQGKQDCLYLNVYTPNLNGKAPVLVHFHGGGFISGNQNNTGAQYFMDENVVVVNVNYRVGIFGFLSFEDKDMPGNQGLKDQTMSLRWVQQNIASFGGDPNRVTLVGESAGAGSVYHHTLSPLSKGLFHGGIAESGTSYGLWSVAPEGFTRKLSMKLLGHLNCSTYTTTREAIACIKSRDPNEVASQLENYREWQIDPIFNFGPVLEPEGPGAFLTGPISSWKHNPVPILMGTTSAEGLLRTLYFPYLNMSYEWYSDNFEEVAPISLLYFASAPNPNDITRQVRQYYFPKAKITEEDWVNITTMYTDAWFTTAVLDGANKHTGNVYFYYFDYLGEKSFVGSIPNLSKYLFGSPHTEEMIYLWYMPFFAGLKGKDLKLSETLVKMWVDFANFGNPTPKGSGVQWEKWTPQHNRYLVIDKNGFKMEEGLAEDRYRFWKSIDFRGNYK